jgi:DNA-directed RNA polymerase subunit RPC12/RpoP
MQPPHGYCITCKAKRELSDTKQIDRGGGPAIEGKCTVCGSKIFVLGAGAPVRANGTTAK